jgi:N-acyl-L-homoserine lactone synthetase
MSDAEVIALGRMKSFCTRILKALAPPLLREVQASSLRPEAEPFNPRRSVRFATPMATSSKQLKKPSAAETVLLKALGITLADLSVENALSEFHQFFDSPVREPHLQVLASIFGKTMPARGDLLRQETMEVDVCV